MFQNAVQTHIVSSMRRYDFDEGECKWMSIRMTVIVMQMKNAEDESVDCIDDRNFDEDDYNG